MNVPSDFPIPDLDSDANTTAGSFPFPFHTVDDPAVHTVESLPFPNAELDDGAAPALAATLLSPPPMHEADPVDLDFPSTLQTAGEPGFDAVMLKALAANPIAVRTLEYLRAQTADKLAALTDQVFSMLAPEEKPTLSKSLPSGPTNIRTLMTVSRNSELRAGNRRELAEALVTGSVINIGNPDWNPADSASSMPGVKNLVCALLQMER